jgi:hypothetical protein
MMKEAVMSISISSARRAAVGAVGAGALAGGLLLGALGTAQAAPAAVSAPSSISAVAQADLPNQSAITAGLENGPMPDWWLHHRWFHRWWWFW